MACLPNFPEWWENAEDGLQGSVELFILEYETGTMCAEYDRQVADNALSPKRLAWLLRASLPNE